MYGSDGSQDAIARDFNSLLHSSTFKHPSHTEFAKIKELISSDSYYHDNNHNHTQRLELAGQTDSSLMRYRSAPSSFFANLLEESGCDDFLEDSGNANASNHNPEERFFSGHHNQQQQKFQSDSHEFLQYESSSMKQEPKDAGIQQLDLSPVYAGSSQQTPPSNSNDVYNPNPNNSNNNNNNLDTSSTFRSMNSTSSNLIRQSSSPAGFLSSLNSENGFPGMRDVEKTVSSNRLNNHISFSSGTSSSQMFLPQIAENRNEMNDSAFRSLKRSRDGDLTTLDGQNGVSAHYTTSLVHHMSLPKTSSEMAVAEKVLRFDQDLIPCKIRAKRGCATHPRSIAERVRRTRISDRMKKLQELFPKMDKHTSTADMLDMAVQHIKDLQKDLQTLKDAKAMCTCSTKQ